MDENESVVDMSGDKVGNCVSLYHDIIYRKVLTYHCVLILDRFRTASPSQFLLSIRFFLTLSQITARFGRVLMEILVFFNF